MTPDRPMFMCSICGVLEDCRLEGPVTIRFGNANGGISVLATACERCVADVKTLEASGDASPLAPVEMRKAHIRGADPVASAAAFHRSKLAFDRDPKRKHLREVP